MKFLIFLSLSFFFILNSYSQTYFKFVGEKSEEIYGELGEIVKEGNYSFAGLVRKGSEKVFSYVLWDNTNSIDSQADYFLTLDLKSYLPIRIKVDLQKKNTLTIPLKSDPNYSKEVKGMHHNRCGEPIYIKYTPQSFRSWEAVPEGVREKVVSELKKQIGEQNFDRLYISSGYILNGPEMQKAGVRNAGHRIVYRMCLSLSDPQNGISQYSTVINFTESGEIIDFPGFPMVDPWYSDEVWSFEKLEEIQKRASKSGYFKKEKTSSTFNFYKRQNRFVWEFATPQGKTEKGETKETIAYFDASTGELLAIFFDKKIVMID